MPYLKLDDSREHYRKDSYIDESNGYWRYKTGEKYKYLHRVIIGAKKGEIVDHINRDKSDNRLSNLRIASPSLNAYNTHIENALGRGIYYDSYGSRYRACISHMNKTLKLGSFKDIDSAKRAYNKKAFEIYGVDAFQHDLPSVELPEAFYP